MKATMDFGDFWLAAPQITHKCARHACVTMLGYVSSYLIIYLSRVFTDVFRMVEHGHNWTWLVMARMDQLWHVQLGHLRPITKLFWRWTVDANIAVWVLYTCKYHVWIETKFAYLKFKIITIRWVIQMDPHGLCITQKWPRASRANGSVRFETNGKVL